MILWRYLLNFPLTPLNDYWDILAFNGAEGLCEIKLALSILDFYLLRLNRPFHNTFFFNFNVFHVTSLQNRWTIESMGFHILLLI